MNKLFSFLFLMSVTFSFARDFDKVDEIVRAYPSKVSNLETIGTLIKKDFNDDSEKARAVYFWIAINFEFDVQASIALGNSSAIAFTYKNEQERIAKESKFKAQVISNSLASGKAICHGYSMIYEKLSTLSGLESKIILGNLKSDPTQIGRLNFVTDHAWNVVKIDKEWKFVDTTLGAGYISQKDNSFKFDFSDAYFFISPEKLFLNHFPEDIRWLIVAKTKKDFAELPLFYRDYFNSNYQLSPEKGIVSSTSPSFRVEIKNLDDYDRVEYVFGSDNNLIYLDNDEKETVFDISLNEKSNDYLTIYINRKIIATYFVK